MITPERLWYYNKSMVISPRNSKPSYRIGLALAFLDSPV